MAARSTTPRSRAHPRAHQAHQAALDRSRAQVAALFDHSLDAVLLTTPDGRILEANPAACAMLGYTVAELTAAGRAGVVDVTDPRLGPALEERARTGRFRGELTLRRKDGSTFPAEISSVVFTMDGEACTSMVIRGLSQRALAEAALRESEERLRVLADAAFEGISIQEDGVIVDCNRALSSMLGYPDGSLIGRASVELVAPESRETVMQHVSTNSEEAYQAVGLRSDGRRITMDIRGRLLPYRGRQARVTVLRDITAQKQAEAAIADRAAQLALITEVAGALVGLLQAEEIAACFLRGVRNVLVGRASAAVVLYERATESLHPLAVVGEAQDRFTGRLYAATVVPQALRERLIDQRLPVVVPDSAALGEAWQGLTAAIPFLRGAGSLAALPLVSRGDLVGALVVVAPDEHSIPAQLVQLLSVLTPYLAGALSGAAVIAQVEAANRQLEHLNRIKTDFVSIVSHEFRTPLTGIQGFSEIIRDETLSTEEVKEFAGDIFDDAQRLNRLISDMLDLDRMESGRMVLHREPVDLNRVITEAAEAAQATAPRHVLRLSLDPRLPVSSADGDKLIQVVTNLLSNAVKYSPNGGEVEVATVAEAGFAHLTVRDQGIGIPAEALEVIFERYARVEGGAGRHVQGTGLGLPIVRQIAEMHGGKAWAESTAGAGSTFHVRLPWLSAQ